MKPGENLGENFCFMCGRTMMTTSPTTALGVNRYKTTSAGFFSHGVVEWWGIMWRMNHDFCGNK